ncbi:LacI family DNA-binding transcriptional regulator [Sphingomonas melonis]|uniref:DNA-binding LacI/PurR family transcriptional regulator n=1 Tax=Sphingomonas melonis TaxID=152682 RepID=A0A7Y9FRX0_9SPHN|nr:LacI family DNA-binding transcriptional regulator [Sphingomonas melonis]NYD92261.1 DNA-binding LacI/PurR family transcriptional regulator [Sphingomonas melonis]
MRAKSLSDLARLSGLSISTISRALSGHWSVADGTRERVRELADEHGYRPNEMARNLRLQRTNAIGIAWPLGHAVGQHLTDPFFLSLVGHVADALVMQGYDIVLSRVLPDAEDWLDRLVDSGKIDGLILIGQSDQADTIARVARRYPPLVVWGAALPEAGYPTVGSDNAAGGRVAARHLLDLGRRRFAFVGDPDLPEFGQRLDGFREVATAAGGAVTVVRTAATFDEADAAVRGWWSDGGRADALFAASDVAAIGAMRALVAAGVAVPEEVAIVGYDDVTLAAHTTPGLTTIRQDVAEGARLLVAALFERLAGRAAASALLPAELIVRGSSVSGGGAALATHG